MKLIIISNRLPLKVVEEENEYKVVPSPGGLSTGLNSLETNMETHWVGWTGMYLEDIIQLYSKQVQKTGKYNYLPV